MSLHRRDSNESNDMNCIESDLNTHMNIESDKSYSDMIFNSNKLTSEFDVFNEPINQPFDTEEQECKFDYTNDSNQTADLEVNPIDKHSDKEEVKFENQEYQLENDIDNDSYWNQSAISNTIPSVFHEDNEELKIEDSGCKLENEEDGDTYWNQTAHSNVDSCDKHENHCDNSEKICSMGNEICNDIYCNDSAYSNVNTDEKYENKVISREESLVPVENEEDVNVYYSESTESVMKKDDNRESTKESDCYDMNVQVKEENVMENVVDSETKISQNSPINQCNERSEPTKKVTNIFKRFDNQEFAGSRCEVCNKTVYPMEKLMMDSKCYHKQCFKCGKCGKTLSSTAASKLNGNIFCKHDYIELFRKRGRYDDICVNGESKNDTGRTSVSSPTGYQRFNYNDNLSKKSFMGYNCVSGDLPRDDGKQAERKVIIDSETSNRVANTRRAWEEGRLFTKNDGKLDNSNNNNSAPRERRSLSLSGRIRDMAAIFEPNQ